MELAETDRSAACEAPEDIRALLSFRLWRVTQANDRIAQRLIRERFGLSLPEWRLMGVVAALAPARFGTLLAELGMDKGQGSRIVKALTGRGLVASEPDPDDQRRIVLRLTDAGRALHARILAFAAERNAVVTGHLDAATARTLSRALDALKPALDAHLAEMGETP